MDPRRLINTFIRILFSLLINSSPFVLAVDFQPVSQDELKMTREPLAPGAPAVILFRQVDRDDNRFTAHEDNYFRIKILTEMAANMRTSKFLCIGMSAS